MKNKFIYFLTRLKNFVFPPVKVFKASDDIVIDYNIRVPLRDKQWISVNLFRPQGSGPFPTIISFHPYGKDKMVPRFSFLARIPYHLLMQPKKITFSDLTGWEAPDPDFWVKNGYAVINADVRGAGKSPGKLKLFSDQEAEDYYDLIEWAASQAWSNGKVGLCGVSYLALSQYKVAALHPPHLAAICPWEGFSDVYQDIARPGGVREDGFFAIWSKLLSPEIRTGQLQHVPRDLWWQALIPNISAITVPTLVCGSFSDHSLHTRGSFRLFKQIKSPFKYLYTHRGPKWAEFYSDEAKALQLDFFNYFLRGEQNGFTKKAPVRLEVRDTGENIHRISEELCWPPENIINLPLYLDIERAKLCNDKINKVSQHKFALADGCITLIYIIPKDMEIIGAIKLKLYLSLDGCFDANIFAAIRKFRDGKEIHFEGSYGYGLDIVTKDCLKVSLRQKSELISIYSQQAFLTKDEIVPIEFCMPETATFFRKNDILRLDIKGNALIKFNMLLSQAAKYEHTKRGRCILYCGDKYESVLTLPILAV